MHIVENIILKDILLWSSNMNVSHLNFPITLKILEKWHFAKLFTYFNTTSGTNL